MKALYVPVPLTALNPNLPTALLISELWVSANPTKHIMGRNGNWPGIRPLRKNVMQSTDMNPELLYGQYPPLTSSTTHSRAKQYSIPFDAQRPCASTH